MKFAQLDKTGAFAKEIDEHVEIEWNDRHLCKAKELNERLAQKFGVVPVVQVEVPVYDHLVSGVRESTPVLLDTGWTQTWEVYPLPLGDQQENRRAVTISKILELESNVTNRRLRDALLTGDTAFIADIEAQIEVLRNKLAKRGKK